MYEGHFVPPPPYFMDSLFLKDQASRVPHPLSHPRLSITHTGPQQHEQGGVRPALAPRYRLALYTNWCTVYGVQHLCALKL